MGMIFYSVTINGFITMMNEKEFQSYLEKYPIGAIQRDACPLKQTNKEGEKDDGA